MLRLREVLELDVVKRAEPEVVAGAGHLDVPVRWVHVTELHDIATLLKGGELLLTTGMGVGRDSAQQRAFVRELAGASVAALMVELGRSLDSIPAAMVAEAEAVHLPVIALHKVSRFVEITEEVHGEIISRQYQLLQRAEAIGRQFTDLALSGAEVKVILETLASVVEDPVIFEDVAHQVVDLATYTSSPEEILRRWENHSRIGHDDQGQRGVVRQAHGEVRCTWVSIWVRGEFWGRIHVLHHHPHPDDLVTLVLDRAAVTVGLSLLAQRDASHLADRARGLLLTDAMRGRFRSSGELQRRARSLGVDLTDKRLVAVVVDLPDLQDRVAERGLSERDRQLIRQAATAALRKAVASRPAVVLAGLEGDRVLGLIGTTSRRDLRALLDTIARDAVHAIRVGQDVSAVVGISRETGTDGLPVAFGEAEEAARYAWRIGRRNGPQHYEDLGLHQLLLPLADRPELSRFVESELGPLLAHDANSAAVLLPTLRVYLGRSRNKSEATRELHIERRTLYRRLERIESVLGRDLSDNDNLIRLTLALYGLDLLRQRAQ